MRKPRERRLRGYSRMRKTELVAFLTIWVKIILHCVGIKGPTVPTPALTFKGL